MITVLCGGVGGAKLVDGLAVCLRDPSALTVIVNTADDWDLWGLRICPDVDTVLYTLAGLAPADRGWGIDGDTWGALEMLDRYGLPAWFRVGDRDLATHVARTAWLREGRRLTEVTVALAHRLGVRARILPMADEPVATVVQTPEGPLPFQEYFVRRRAEDPVRGVEFSGIEGARLTPEVREAITAARVIIVAPSNPVVSIGPILAVPGLRAALDAASGLCLAVTPLVGGQALKGPTVEMLVGTGLGADPAAVARLYRSFLDVFVLDERDRELTGELEAAAGAGRRVAVACADTIMRDRGGRRRLAREVLRIAAGHGAALPPDLL